MKGNDEFRAKILMERYKLYADKRKYCLDEIKYFAWLDATFIALNTLSISTGKLFGIIPAETHALIGLCSVNIIMIAYGLMKIVALIRAGNVLQKPATSDTGSYDRVNYSWDELIIEIEMTIDKDIEAIVNMNETIAWSFSWLSRGLAMNALVLIFPLLPSVLSWLKE